MHQDALAECAWQLVVHQTPKVRCFASKYLNVMSQCCLEDHDDILGNKLLPGKFDNVFIRSYPYFTSL